MKGFSSSADPCEKITDTLRPSFLQPLRIMPTHPTSRWTLVDYHLVLLVPLAVFTHLYLTPFTKVEESFNIQALHDWLFLGVKSLDKWDHIQFPGAVPRSFIPSLLLAIFSYPVLLAGKVTGVIADSSDVQFALRAVLGAAWSAAAIFFVTTVSDASAKYTSTSPSILRRTLLLLTATQFHLPFWATRTTPNGLAFPSVLVSLALILPRGLANERRHIIGVGLLTFTAVVYRLELAVVLAACGLYLVHSRFTAYRSEFDPHPIESSAKLAGTTHASMTLSGAASVLLDTYMWRSKDTWIVPEAEGVKFNVFQGKSQEWGVSPWHYYLTSSLPKMLGGASLFALIGVVLALHSVVVSRRTFASRKGLPARERRFDVALAAKQSGTIPTFVLVWIPLVHVAVLSLLKHKEWRFIAYIVPVLNLLAATAVAKLWSLTSTSALKRTALTFALATTLLLNIVTTFVSLSASSLNYPGGEALRDLHSTVPANSPLHVHISTLPAMTGVTLFQSKHLQERSLGAFGLPSLPLPAPTSSSSSWTYSKTENIDAGDQDAWQQYTHLLSDRIDCELPAGDVSLFKPLLHPKREFERLAVASTPLVRQPPASSAQSILKIPGLISLSVATRDPSPSVSIDFFNVRRVTLAWRTREAVGICVRTL